MSIKQRTKVFFHTRKNIYRNVSLDVYGDGCLSHGTVHEWCTRFNNGREDINDVSHVGQPQFVIKPKTMEKVPVFLIIQPKSSLCFMDMELGMSKDSIYRILTDY